MLVFTLWILVLTPHLILSFLTPFEGTNVWTLEVIYL